MHAIEVGEVKAVVYGMGTFGTPEAFELVSTRGNCTEVFVESQLENLTEVLERVRAFYAEAKTH